MFCPVLLHANNTRIRHRKLFPEYLLLFVLRSGRRKRCHFNITIANNQCPVVSSWLSQMALAQRRLFFFSFSVVVDVFAGLYGLFFGLSPETVVLLQRKSNKQTNKKFKNSTLSLSHHLSLLNPSSSSTACWTSGSH